LPAVKKISETHQEARLFVLKNCGHVVNVEQPKVFNSQVIEFIKSLDQPSNISIKQV
jgi:pimeloyl-ACP methyl ester carboxylesterase